MANEVDYDAPIFEAPDGSLFIKGPDAGDDNFDLKPTGLTLREVQKRAQQRITDEPSLSKTASQFLLGLEEGATVATPRAIGGGFEFAGGLLPDAIGGAALRKAGREAREGAGQIGKEYEDLSEGVGGGGAAKFARGLGSSVIPSASALLAAAPLGVLGAGAGATVTGSAVASGLQSLGGTFADAFEANKKRGMSDDEAYRKSYTPAVLSGLVTGLVTKGFGGTGLEPILLGKAVPKGFAAAVKAVAKDVGMEAVEEATDEAWQAVIRNTTFNPEATAEDNLKGILQAGIAGGLMAGAVRGGQSAPSAVNDLLTKKPGATPAPLPAQPAPAAPVTPAPVAAPQVAPPQVSQRVSVPVEPPPMPKVSGLMLNQPLSTWSASPSSPNILAQSPDSFGIGNKVVKLSQAGGGFGKVGTVTAMTGPKVDGNPNPTVSVTFDDGTTAVSGFKEFGFLENVQQAKAMSEAARGKPFEFPLPPPSPKVALPEPPAKVDSKRTVPLDAAGQLQQRINAARAAGDTATARKLAIELDMLGVPPVATPKPRRTAITPEAQAAAPKRQQVLPEAASLPEPLEGQPYDTRLTTRPEASMPAIPVAELGIERGRVSPVDPDLAAAVEDIRGGYAERTTRELATAEVAAPAAVKPVQQEIPASSLTPAERSTPAGQKKMASEAASVATVTILNKKVREKSPGDAWDDKQIQAATGNQSLLNSIRDDLLPIFNRLYKQAEPQPPYAPQEQAPVEVLRNQPPGTPAQVAEEKPREVSEAAGEGAPEKRDKSKPEQMTPEEWTSLLDIESPSLTRTDAVKRHVSQIRSNASHILRKTPKEAEAILEEDQSIVQAKIAQLEQVIALKSRLDPIDEKKRAWWEANTQKATPAEWWAEDVGIPDAKASLKNLALVSKSLSSLVKLWGVKHSTKLKDAAENYESLSASAVDTYGIKLPPGYIREGDLYVYRPEVKPEEGEAAKADFEAVRKTLKSAYPFAGVKTGSEERAFLAKAKRLLKPLGVPSDVFDRAVESQRRPGNVVIWASDSSVMRGLLKQGWIKEPSAIDPGEQQVLDEISKLKSVTGPLSQSERIDLNELRLSAQNKKLSRLSQAYLENLEERAGRSGEQYSLGGKAIPTQDYLPESLWSVSEQEFSSAGTSINEYKLPTTFTSIKFKPGTVNADIGGGRFNNATEKLKGDGVENVIFDPFNRTKEWNDAAVARIRDGQADTATINNVLNVIKEPANRLKVIAQAANAIKPDGVAYFKIYEGDGKKGNVPGPTKKDSWQEKRKASTYVDEILQHFNEVSIVGDIITAKGPKKFTQQSGDIRNSLGQPPAARPAPSLSKMQVEQAVRELFDGNTPPNFQVTHNYGKVFNGREVRGWYDPATGTIWLNAAYLRSPQEARLVFAEEAMHAVQNDPAVKDAMSRLVNSLTAEQLAEKRTAYGNIPEEQLQMEAVSDFIKDRQLKQEQMNLLEKLWDAVLGAIQRLYGKFTGKVFTERDAQDVLAKALKAAAVGKRSLKVGGEVYAEGGLAAKAKAFFSRLFRTVEQSQQNKASGAQWKATIKNSKLGANLDEMALVGVNDLEDGKMYSRQDVLDYLQANQVDVKDVTLGGATKESLSADMDRADRALFEKVKKIEPVEVRGRQLFSDEIGWELVDGSVKPSDLPANLQADAERWLKTYQARQGFKEATPTHFSTYQLPGAKEGSYREVLLTMPSRPVKGLSVRPYGDKGRWGVFNANGSLLEAYTDQANAESAMALRANTWRDGHSQYSSIANPIVRLRFNERTTQDGKRMLFLEEVQAPQKGQFEKMPPLFQKNWREIAFKWALRHAAENGFEVIGWTTGEQQAERYDLSKQVRRIEWQSLNDRPGQVLLSVFDTDSRRVMNEWMPHEKVESVVGKDVASKILESRSGVLKGEGLKIGGEGLKKLYDVDFRNVVNKLPAVRNAGGKAGVAEIVVGTPNNNFNRQNSLPLIPNETATVHSLPITPAIADSVMGGQAMFSAGSPQNQLDQKYFEAIQRGDMQEVQALVDEAARGAGSTANSRAKFSNLLRGRTPAVDSGVSSRIYDSEVLKPVIEAIPVEVVNMLGSKQGATNALLNNPSVFKDALSASKAENLVGESSLARLRDEAMSVAAGARAELALIPPADLDRKMFTAVDALQHNLIAAVGYKPTVSGSGGENTLRGVEDLRSPGDGKTLRVAESTFPTGNLAGEFKKLDSADFTGAFNLHKRNNPRDAGLLQELNYDPITYDDSGNIIPLSQRFQQESPDIRYSLGERVKGPQEDNLGAKYTDAIRASESSGSRQDFLRGTDAQIEAAIIGADVSAMVRQGVGYEGRPSGAVRGLRSGTESAAGKAVPKVRVFISTDALDSTARKNSEILASRIFPAESGTQAAALSDMDEGDFVLTAARRTPFFVTIFSAEGEKSPLARTQTLADGTPAIIFNTTNLGKFNLQDAATAAQFDGVLSEELIHVAAISVTSQKEAQDVWASLSDKEKKAAERSYNRRRNKDALSDYELGHEYLRMVIQERMFGKTTEQVELRITEPVKKFLRKLLNFIKEAFGKKPENDIARQLVSRIESALNGETPRQSSIIPSGTSLATNISQSDATEVQGRAIEPSVIAAAGRAVADLGRQTVEEYEQAGRELEGLAYESKAFRQARSELNNLVSLHEGRLRQLPQDRVTDDMRANIRDGVSIENGQIVVGDDLVTKLAQMGVQFRPELVKALQAEVHFEQQARRLVDNLGKLATLKELKDYYTNIKAPADEILKLDKLIAAKEKVVANLTPVTTNRGRGQQSIGERASEITRANASKVELQAKRDALTLEPVQEFFGKGITELRDLSEKAKAAADLTRALMDSSTSISEVARLGEIYDKWASFDRTVKDALKQGTLTDEQRSAVLTSLQRSFEEFDIAKSQMDDLLNSEEKGLLKDIRLAETDIADAKVTSGLADVLVADALKAAKGEMGLTGTVGDAANITNLEASTGAITTLAMNLGQTLDQNRWLYDFLMAPGDMPAFGASVAQSLGISETALREVLKVVQQSPSLASAIVTLTDDAAAKLANSPPNQMQSIAQLATSGNPVAMVLAANLTSQIVQQANAQGTKANAARQTAARQLAQSVLRLRTLQQGQALFNQTANSPAFQQLRSAVATGASEAQKMVVLGPTGPVLRGFKSAAKEYQPELKIDVDTSALELSQTRDKVWKYLQNAEQYIADYEAAAALYTANPANPSPSQLGFDVADYNGLKFAIENQIAPMFLNMGDMDDTARAAQYLTPVGVRKFMKLPAFLGQIFNQYEQLGKMVGGFAGNTFRQQIAKYKRGYLNAKGVASQFQDLPKLQSAAMQSHNIRSEDTYRRIFNEMAHYGRLFGTPLRVGFTLPISNQVVTKADMEFLKRTLAFEEKLRREVTEIDPVTGVRYMRGGKEITRKGAYTGDLGMPRHMNRGATQFIADITNDYAATPKGFTPNTDLSASSQDKAVKYWNEHLGTLKQHILDSLRTDRSFKQSAEMAAAEKRIAARWLAGNMNQVNSVQDLVDLIAAEIPTTSGKNPLDTAREGLNNELLQYVAHAERIQKERAEDNAKTSGLSIALSSENEYTKPAAYLELPSEYYDYGAVSSIDRITAQARSNHSALIDFANSIRLAITELRNRLERLKKATTDKERALILENYKGNQQEMEDVLELLTTSLKNFEDSYRAGGPDLVPTRLGQKILKATVGSVLAKVEIAIRNLSQGQLQVFTNLRAMNYMSARLAAWKALSNVPRGMINTSYMVARNIAGFADRRLGRDPQFQRTLKGAVDVVADGIFKTAQAALFKPMVGAENVRKSFERVFNLGFDTSGDSWDTIKQAWIDSGQFRNQIEQDKAMKTRTSRAINLLDRLANTALDSVNAVVRGSVLESSDTGMNALSLGLVGNMEQRLEEVAMVFGKRLTDLGITRIDPTDKRAVLQANEWLPSLNQQTASNSLGEIRKFLESSASSEGFNLEQNLLKYYQDKMAGRPAKIFNQRTFDAVQRSMIAENNAALPTNRASAGQASTLWRTLLTLQGYPADAFLKMMRIATGGTRDRKAVLQAASKISLALGVAALAIIVQGSGDAGAELWKRKMQGKRADRPTPLDADFYTDPDHLKRAMGNYLLLSSYYVGDIIRGAYGWVDGRSTIDPLQKAFALATASQIARDISSGVKIAMKGGTTAEVLEPLRKSITRLTFGAPEIEQLLGKERDNTEAARRGITENAKAKGFDLPAPGFSGTVGLTNIKRKALSQAVSDMDIAKRKGDTEGYNKAKAEAQKQLTELEAYYLKQRLEAGDSPEVAAKTAKASVWGDYQENNPVTAALGGKRPTVEQYKQLVGDATTERGQSIRQGIKAWQDGAQALFGKSGNITKEDVAENRPSGTVREPSYGRVSLTGGVSGRMRSVGTVSSRGRRAKIRRVSLTGRRRKISPIRSRRKKIRRVRLTA